MARMDYLTGIPWETRNLGLQSMQIKPDAIENLNKNALAEEIRHAESEYGNIFIQAFVNTACLSRTPALCALGFYSVETRLIAYARLQRNPVLQRFSEHKDEFLPGRYHQEDFRLLREAGVSTLETEEIIAMAKDTFSMDRFHIDPNCTDEVADRRYANWAMDVMSNSYNDTYILYKGEEIVGFMLGSGDQIYLAAMAKKWRYMGLGDYLWLSVFLNMRNRGLGRVHSKISANNTAALNTYVRTSCRFKESEAVFHYWSSV